MEEEGAASALIGSYGSPKDTGDPERALRPDSYLIPENLKVTSTSNPKITGKE